LDIHFTVGTSCERAAPLAEKNAAARHHVLRSLISLHNEHRIEGENRGTDGWVDILMETEADNRISYRPTFRRQKRRLQQLFVAAVTPLPSYYLATIKEYTDRSTVAF
jgi:hypothetical protein